MTLLEQKFFEMVPSALRGIENALTSIANKMAAQQPEYVWVFTAEQTADDDTFDLITKVFATEQAARKYLDEFVHDDDEGELAYAKKRGWTVEYDEPDHYRAYEEGYYLGNHTEAKIEKQEVIY
jgi:hypothetical protein